MGSDLTEKVPTVAPKSINAAFESWWSLWTIPGTKRGKIAARRKYRIARKNGDGSTEEIDDGVDRYMDFCRANRTEVRYILHPATFLHGGHWTDDYPEPRQTETDLLQRIYDGYRAKEAKDGNPE